MTTLERLEAASGRAYKHTRHDAELARAKAATNPAALTDMDVAIIGFFHGADAAEQARGARTAATAPRRPRLTPFEEQLAHTIADILREVIPPLTRRLASTDAKVAALQATVAMLEARTTKDGDAR